MTLSTLLIETKAKIGTPNLTDRGYKPADLLDALALAGEDEPILVLRAVALLKRASGMDNLRALTIPEAVEAIDKAMPQ